MATQESMAIRCDTALSEIETLFSEMLGYEVESLPRIKQDREMLRVIQLEQIGLWLTELAGNEALDKDATLVFETRMTELAPSPLHPTPVAAAKRRRRK